MTCFNCEHRNTPDPMQKEIKFFADVKAKSRKTLAHYGLRNAIK